MRVFVTGATGFVGREVLRQLDRAGHSARILARHPESQGAINAAKLCSAEIVAGDVLNPAPLTQHLKDIDAVIHLVGIISEAGRNTYESIHTRGTQNMVAAAKEAGVRRFELMSALGTRPNAVARYHQSKWAAEEIVRASGLDYTIFCPSIIYGPEDHFVNLFARMTRLSPLLPVMGNGLAKLQPVSVENVAKAFVRALDNLAAIGKTFELCGPEALTFNEVMDAIMQSCGRKRWKLHLPLPMARVQAAMLEFVFGKMLGKPPPLNRDQLKMLAEDNVGDPHASEQLFSLQSTPFRVGIARYLGPNTP